MAGINAVALKNKPETLCSGFRSGLLEVVKEAPRINGRRAWFCRCDCGNNCIVTEDHLKSKHTKSCGCLSRKHPIYVPGMKIGNLTLLEEVEKKGKYRYWHCRCDCGNERVVQESHLKSGHTKSCGCLSRKHPTYSPGMKVWNLTLLEEVEKKGKYRYWHCRCDCGNECIVQEGHLKSGHTKSCGCLQAQIREENSVEAMDISGQRFGRLVALEPTTKRNKSSVVWKCLCDCGRTTFCDVEALNRGQTRSCGCLLEEQRKLNMQTAIHFVDGTCIEKIACQRESAANTSGHRGVYPLKNGKFRASITFRGKRYDLGTHKTFEEAVEARLLGEKIHFGEYLESYYAKQENSSSPD